jgi:hypothetical protein
MARLEYIYKALTVISQHGGTSYTGAECCDWIGYKFSTMTRGQVKVINDQLNLGLQAWNLRGVNLQGKSLSDVADLKRAALLLELLNAVPANATANAASATALDQLIKNNIRNKVAPPAGGGYYFKGSFWAFARSQEFDWVVAGWNEAVAMIDAGLDFAGRATQPGQAKRITDRWFGTTPAATITQQLTVVKTDMTAKKMGLCYQGLGAAANKPQPVQYKEIAYKPGSGPVLIEEKEWGWAPPKGTTHRIGFGIKFFNENTEPEVNQAHTLGKGVMEVSRGGAVLHELTHRFIFTKDHRVPNEAYYYLEKPAPIQVEKVDHQNVVSLVDNRARHEAYGPRMCNALAQSRPDLAISNADNYRLFCEDAFYYQA